MDITTANAIISGSAGLIGALIGAMVTYVSGAQQHKRQEDKERTQVEKVREETAAKECEQACLQIASMMESVKHPMHAKHDAVEMESDRLAREAHAALGASALYLPDTIRKRVELLGSIALNADDIAYGNGSYGHTHYDQPYTICWNIKKEIRLLTSAFLRAQEIPELSRKVEEYQAALDDLMKEKEEFYSMMDSHDEQEQRREREAEHFYRKHPDLRPK